MQIRQSEFKDNFDFFCCSIPVIENVVSYLRLMLRFHFFYIWAVLSINLFEGPEVRYKLFV